MNSDRAARGVHIACSATNALALACASARIAFDFSQLGAIALASGVYIAPNQFLKSDNATHRFANALSGYLEIVECDRSLSISQER